MPAAARPAAPSLILLEFWQLASSASRDVPPSTAAGDVRVLAAHGTQPTVSVEPDGHLKIVPPIRDPDTGLTPVGTFQDDAAVVYDRPVSRLFISPSSPVTDVGRPLDKDTW